jgi:cation diffusion facilitator family transporter
MVSESAHSLADTVNELLLLTAVKRSDRPADARHPFGYGRERYFWSLLAAVGIFVVGGVFSVMQGVDELRHHGREGGHYPLIYAVLGISFVLETVSWVQARRQVHEDAEGMRRGAREQLWATTDPTVTTVFLEDSAALLGLVIAALGVGLHQVTGSHLWDGLASLAIGLLLAAIGIILARQNRSLLIGAAADPRLHDAVLQQLSSYPEVDAVDEVLTSVVGRGEVLVAARIDLDDALTAGQVEALARRMEDEIVAAHPTVRHFFLDVTADHRRPTD